MQLHTSRLIHWAAAATTLSVFLSACTKSEATTPSTPTTPDTPSTPETEVQPSEIDGDLSAVDITDIRLSTGSLVLPYATGQTKLEVSSLYAGTPFTITVVGTEGGSAAIDGTVIPLNTPYTMTLPTLGSDVAIHVRHRSTNNVIVEDAISTLPSDYPGYAVTSDGASAGRVFIGMYSWTDTAYVPYGLILDAAGKPLFYQRAAKAIVDFKAATLPNGKTRYLYSSSGYEYILDDQFAVLKMVKLLATERHGVLATEPHDFLLLDDDHWIVSAYQTKQVANIPDELRGENAKPYVIASVLQEVQDGQVVFEWDSTEHPELYGRSSEGNDYAGSTEAKPADYVHFNALAIDPSDGNWVVSLRHQDAILKIRKSDGGTAWTLGGIGDDFGLTAEQKFSHQHSVHIDASNHLYFFDNGNASEATRIVEVTVDPEAQIVTNFTSVAANRFSNAMGSVQRIDDRYFIGWGAHTNGDEPDVTEIDPTTGTIHFSINFVDDVYSYRAFKLP